MPKHGPATLGFDVVLLATFVVVALTPWDIFYGSGVHLSEMLQGPSLRHPLGTDNLGRDLIVRIAAALRDGVLPLWLTVVAASAGGFAVAFAALVVSERRGLRPAVAGLTGLAALIASIPVGIAAFALAVFQEKAGLAPVAIALGTLFAVRAFLEAMNLYRHDRELGFWEAHHSMGGSLANRLWRYGARGGWSVVILDSLGFHLKAAVAIEAALSYLGFGIQEPQASFGNMLASHFDLYLKGDWYVLAVIVGALALTAAAPTTLGRLALGWRSGRMERVRR